MTDSPPAGSIELAHTHIRTQRGSQRHELQPTGKRDLDDLLSNQHDAGWELVHYSTSTGQDQFGGVEIYHDMIWRWSAQPPAATGDSPPDGLIG